ncbi:hypothetical protein M407DRAFT_18886 [Tulasnella calospora MUT 4182]|uniref:Uncharacterized protein n=1 Tax=Tulasnella calospora MUT 4182 TaxID=1051891 RepID=A0A0C3QIU9_9AGAM|nr:hypothetical protein M407DRAFT_18886 [Tulasnella calospora MUT 4182]
MQEVESGEDAFHLDIFVDMDPVTICALAECGEFEGGQFLALMKRCSDNVIQRVFETIDKATLEAFLMRSDDFQPLLDLAVAALGADSLQSHVKRWLTKASQARAKKEIVRAVPYPLRHDKPDYRRKSETGGPATLFVNSDKSDLVSGLNPDLASLEEVFGLSTRASPPHLIASRWPPRLCCVIGQGIILCLAVHSSSPTA